jgi:uncharacterized membrane protein
MSDNVTRFPARRQEPKPPMRGGKEGQIAMATHALTVLAFAIFLFLAQPWTYLGYAVGGAALLISASKRNEGPPWAARHFEFILRTIIIGAVSWTLGGLAGMVVGVIGFVVTFATFGWVVIRSLAGLWQAFRGLAIDNSKTFFL